MFRTKKDVDLHCKEVLKKCSNDKEANLRCLSIAQQYLNVNDFDSAKKYILRYISEKNDSPEAHKILAQCHEHFGDKEEAFREYKYSLNVCPKQSPLILKVCELLASNSVSVDKNELQHWLGKAECQFPYHPTVFELKKRLSSIVDGNSPESVESILLDELKSKPKDAVRHTQLLTFYEENGRIKEAYEKAFNDKVTFVPTLQWYQCADRVCKLYRAQFPTSLNENFYANYLFVLERMLALSAQDVKIHRKSIPECISFLASFDEALNEAANLVNKSDKFLQILHHMCGQLCFHIAIILFRKAKWENNGWPEYTQLIAPLLLLSTADKFKLRQTVVDGPFANILGTCIQLNVYRISQAGFVLFSMAKESQKHFMEKIFHYCSSNLWKQRIFDKLYYTSETKKFNKSSFFTNYSAFNDLPQELTRTMLDNVDHFVSATEMSQPMSLHHLVWLGVQCLILSNKESICDLILPIKFTVKTMNTLQFSYTKLAGWFAESLCKLDVDAFLYACVYRAKSFMDANKSSTTFNLPADVAKSLCRPEFEQWWEYACQMVTLTIPVENFSRVRSTLQRGIECVRLEGNHTLPLQLLVLLGRTFASRATVESDSYRATELESRAALYWKAAIPLLEKIVRNETVSISSKSMIDHYGKLITKAEASKLHSEGKRFLGMRNVKENDYLETSVNGGDFDEIENIVSIESPSKNVAYDEKLLQNVHEQNTQILGKLETLFNKQELLSSNQLQLFEIVSSLSKRLEDFLVIPNDEYLNALSAADIPSTTVAAAAATTNSLPCASYFSKPTVAAATATPPSAPALLAQNYVGTNMYPLPPVQTSFPMYPLTGTTALPPSMSSLSSYFGSFLPSTTTTPSYVSQFSPAVSPFFADSKTVASSNETSAAKITTFDTTPKLTPSRTGDVVRDLSKRIDLKTPEQQQPPTGTPPSQHSFQIPMINTSMVRSPSVQVPDECEESDADEPAAERDPIPDFKPIIPLPDEVEVTTGEEDEETVFESRAKLFRFVDREWKERGLGNLKMLKNPKTERVRILMRRDVVHKICANHFLCESMTLTPQASSDRAWVYCAGDFADERLTVEKFAVKFKTVELAMEFKRKFDEYKVASSSSSSSPAKSSPATTTKDVKKAMVLTPSKFDSETKTIAEADTKAAAATTFGGFTFSSSPVVQTSPVLEKKPAPKVEATKPAPFASLASFDMAAKPPTSSSIFPSLFATTTGAATVTFSSGGLFGSAVSAKPASICSDDSAPFASVKSTVDFSSLSKNADTTAFAKSKDFKGFEGAGSKVFGNAAADKIPSTVQAILKNVPVAKTDAKNDAAATVADNAEGVGEEFVPTAEFTPVIPLPELVEVTTGEEGMESLYEEHCKLFRYVDNQWKERGVGKMKLLRDPATGKVRMMMRRDQVHKVCCNQWLTANHELKPLSTSNKAFCWSAPDFSEGESKIEQFCVRFKTEALAQKFHEVIEETKATLSPVKSGACEAVSDGKAAPAKLPSLSEMFKSQADLWECKSCYTKNKNDANVCVCCQQTKDGTTAAAVAPSSNTSSFSSFSFGSTDKKFVFGSSSGANQAANKFSFGLSSNPSTPATSTFSFGTPPAPSNENAGAKPFFSSNASTFNFGASSASKSESGGLLFGSPSTFTTDNSSSVSPAVVFGAGGSATAEGSTNAYTNFSFKLTDEVSVTRTKTSNEIPELSSQQPKQNQWAAQSKQEDSTRKLSSQSSDEVEFVSETDIPEEDRKLAETLMLPASHFAYKYSDKKCTGCVGCDPEDRERNAEKAKSSERKVDTKTLNTNSVDKNGTLSNTASNSGANFIFGGFGENSSWMNKPVFNFGGTVNLSNVSNNGDVSVQKTDGEGDTDDEKDASVVSNDHEPYFEPIIPLPKIVEVKTGEEDESIEFCERAKIFRYDENKREWKERGIGNLKILHHPIQNTYRLLLRREQVHKVVLNQRITSTLVLQPMSTNNNSCCWGGMNLPEESNEPVIEKLAARFKTEEICNKFQNAVNSCIERLENANFAAAADEATYDGGDEGDTEREIYEDEYVYVDEQGIVDAMEDPDEGGEIVFECDATLEVVKNDASAHYNGYVRLVKCLDEVDDDENVNNKSLMVFSTDKIPSVYKANVESHAKPFLENNCAVFPDGDERIIVQFDCEENAEAFYCIYETLSKTA